MDPSADLNSDSEHGWTGTFVASQQALPSPAAPIISSFTVCLVSGRIWTRSHPRPPASCSKAVYLSWSISKHPQFLGFSDTVISLSFCQDEILTRCPSFVCSFLSSAHLQYTGLREKHNDPEENLTLGEATLFPFDKLSFPTPGSNYKDMKYEQLDLGTFQSRFLKPEA